MIEALILAILALIPVLVKAWLAYNQVGPVVDKNKALEKAAQEAREKEHAANVKEGKAIVTSDDRDAAIDFLRDSFHR